MTITFEIPRLSRRCFGVFCAGFAVSACMGGPEGPAIYANLSQAGTALNAGEAASLINAYRQTEGLAPVRVNNTLMTAATTESRAIAAKAGAAGRVAPIPGLKDRLAALGYNAVSVEQNVSAGYFTMAEAFSGWRQSDSHRDTLLAPAASDMGIAALRVPNAKYKVYWTLIMAAPTGAA